jgi:murein L,D-transpeptidase YcbB/YkuD
MKKRFMIAMAAATAIQVFLASPALASDEPGEAISSFQAQADAYYDDMGFSSNHYNYTQKELMMLANVIHNEVRGESYEAMLAVGNVVMNRVLSPGYPGDTIEDVVTRPNQFCYRPSVKPMAKCIQAAKDVLEREVWVIPQDIYFFRATGSHADWGKHEYYKHIGTTAFYHDSYPGRSNVRAIPAALYKRVYEWPQYGCEPGLRVVKVQRMLNALGYKTEEDGYFGRNLRGVLIRFQKNEGLTADGVANPATLNRLIQKTNGRDALDIMN